MAVPAVGGRAVAVPAVGTSARSVALLESSKSLQIRMGFTFRILEKVTVGIFETCRLAYHREL